MMKRKAKAEEESAAQGMTGIGRVYTQDNLAQGGTSKEAASKPFVVKIGTDDLWRKVQDKEYSIVDDLNKTPAHISILSLLQNSDAHMNALLKVLSDGKYGGISTINTQDHFPCR